MSAETRLYSALSGDAAVTAIVGRRIYPVTAPEDDVYPMVVYGVLNVERVRTVCDAVGTSGVYRIQVDSYAKTYAEAKTLGSAVLGVIADLGGITSLSVEQDEHNQEMDLHLVPIEYTTFSED